MSKHMINDLFVSQNTREFYASQDRFWIVQIPFGSIVKFQFLAQFLVNQLLDQVMSIIIISSSISNIKQN